MADSIDSFVRGVLLRHHLWQALGVLLVHALAVALVLLVVDAGLPGWVLEPTLWVGGGWLCYILVRELLGLWLGRRRLQVADLDSGLGMQDMLTTLWLDRGHGALSAWLRRDVSVRLARVPAARRRRLWWGACRRVLLLLPVVALLIWLGPFASILPIGLQPGGKPASSRVAGKGAGAAQQGPSSKEQPQDEEQTRAEQKPETRNQEQPPAGGRTPRGDSNAPPGQPQPPKPLIAGLPVQKEFVVPTWIHEGPSTRTTAPVVDAPPPGRRQPGGQPVRRRTGPPPQDPREATPKEQQLQEFRRAAERALHARHVPQAERPFVRRYFRELVDGRRGR